MQKYFHPKRPNWKFFLRLREKTFLAKTLIASNRQSSFFCRISYTVCNKLLKDCGNNAMVLETRVILGQESRPSKLTICSVTDFVRPGWSSQAKPRYFHLKMTRCNLKWIFMRRLRNFDNQMFTLLIGWFIWNSTSLGETIRTKVVSR